MPTIDTDNLVGVNELADMCDVGRGTIYKWLERNKLPEPLMDWPLRWNKDRKLVEWAEERKRENSGETYVRVSYDTTYDSIIDWDKLQRVSRGDEVGSGNHEDLMWEFATYRRAQNAAQRLEQWFKERSIPARIELMEVDY